METTVFSNSVTLTFNDEIRSLSSVILFLTFFKGKMNGWCRARFTVVDYDDDGKIWHVIYSVECIDEEKKRESTEGKDILNNNPPKDWNLDKSKESQQEMLKTVPVNLNYYYKEKVNSYFYNIE